MLFEINFGIPQPAWCTLLSNIDSDFELLTQILTTNSISFANVSGNDDTLYEMSTVSAICELLVRRANGLLQASLCSVPVRVHMATGYTWTHNAGICFAHLFAPPSDPSRPQPKLIGKMFSKFGCMFS